MEAAILQKNGRNDSNAQKKRKAGKKKGKFPKSKWRKKNREGLKGESTKKTNKMEKYSIDIGKTIEKMTE